MKKIFTTYKIQLVKEEAKKYEIEKNISSPREVKDVLYEVAKINLEPEEVFLLITLDIKNNLTGIFEVSRGNINSSIVHPREVYKRAMLSNSCSIIVAHNHPSGDPSPSKEDINITKRLKECGDILGIQLLDHIIIGSKERYISFKEKGMI